MTLPLLATFSEVPPKSAYNPVRKAIEASKDRPEVAAALKLFSSMPPSTAILANPVRHHQRISVRSGDLELDIRSFTVRGLLFEEDIVSGRADAIRVIFVGLFGRFPSEEEAKAFHEYLRGSVELGVQRSFETICDFMKRFPEASPDVAILHWASIRKATQKTGQVRGIMGLIGKPK
jgi:hypothetical protein